MLGQFLVECADMCTLASTKPTRRPTCRSSLLLPIFIVNIALVSLTFPFRLLMKVAVKIYTAWLQAIIKKMEAAL